LWHSLEAFEILLGIIRAKNTIYCKRFHGSSKKPCDLWPSIFLKIEKYPSEWHFPLFFLLPASDASPDYFLASECLGCSFRGNKCKVVQHTLLKRA
jgi:hypothetical protein